MSNERKTDAPKGAGTRRIKGGSLPPPAPGKQGSTVAWLGLGAMGRPMARRLVDAGYDLRVFNRTPGRDKDLVKAGALSARTPYDAVNGASFVLTMVADAHALLSLMSGKRGVLAGLAATPSKRRPVVVDMSTIGREAAVEVSEMAREAGVHFVDAPVSGSVGPAARGELVALVGGGVRVVERVRPLLGHLCRALVHAGGPGQGQALKVVLNGLGAHHLVALASMLALGERVGLARDVVLDAVTSGAFATPSYVSKRAKILAHDYTPDFSLALTLKDCRLATDLARRAGIALPVLSAIEREVDTGVRAGLGHLDLYALEKMYR